MNAEPGLVAVILILDKFVQVTSTNHSSNFASTYAVIVFSIHLLLRDIFGKVEVRFGTTEKETQSLYVTYMHVYIQHVCD